MIVWKGIFSRTCMLLNNSVRSFTRICILHASKGNLFVFSLWFSLQTNCNLCMHLTAWKHRQTMPSLLATFSTTYFFCNSLTCVNNYIWHFLMLSVKVLLPKIGVFLIYVTFCCFACFVLCLFLYGPFCHGFLKLDPIYIVCNIFLWTSISFVLTVKIK